MPIFKISGNNLQKIKPVKFSGSGKEKSLQNLIENNLNTIFEMTFLETEFSTSHGGRIDTIAIDSDNRPVIIEYKADKSSTILLQGLFYMDWIVDNKAEFEKLVRNKLKKEIDVNWNSGVRLLLIAKSFEIWDKFAVNRIKEEVELFEYTLYENNEIKLEKTALPKDFKSTKKTAITTISEYSVDDHLNKIKNGIIRNKVIELKERLVQISDEIVERATKEEIIFKSSINFATIFTQQKQYWFAVKLPKSFVRSTFNDLDVRPHKDEVYTRIRCNEKTNLDELITLAEHAYENTL